MCGIAGVVSYHRKVEEAEVNAMINTLSHRGPDYRRIKMLGAASLAHARLSIIDLSEEGAQPMCTNDERYWISYNGEIYNYKELKSELEALSIPFRSLSDTEVILNGFAKFGIEWIKKLNGIFAIAMWDTVEEKLILCRDRFGVKPLFYTNEESFFFASEIKAILQGSHKTFPLNYKGVSEYFHFGNVIGEETLYGGIFQLPAGKVLQWDKNGFQIFSFWELHREIHPLAGISEQEYISQTEIVLEKAIQRQLISDVEVSLLLSAGLDSNTVAYYAAKHYGSTLQAYHADFGSHKLYDESELAQKSAKNLGIAFNRIVLHEKDIPSALEKVSRSHDQAFGDAANVPLYLLSKEITPRNRVVLQGDGGDEMFGGYPWYKKSQQYLDVQSSFYLKEFYSLVVNLFPEEHRISRYAAKWMTNDENLFLSKVVSEEPSQLLFNHCFNNQFAKTLLAQNPYEKYMSVLKDLSNFEFNQRLLYLDVKMILSYKFLEKVDRSTMAFGLESRVPFLDNELAQWAMSTPYHLKRNKTGGKWILRKIMSGKLEDEIVHGKKKGFGTPINTWLASIVFEMFNDLLSSVEIKNSGMFQLERIRSYLARHKAGDHSKGIWLWQMFQFMLWWKNYHKYIR